MTSTTSAESETTFSFETTAHASTEHITQDIINDNTDSNMPVGKPTMAPKTEPLMAEKLMTTMSSETYKTSKSPSLGLLGLP